MLPIVIRMKSKYSKYEGQASLNPGTIEFKWVSRDLLSFRQTTVHFIILAYCPSGYTLLHQMLSCMVYILFVKIKNMRKDSSLWYLMKPRGTRMYEFKVEKINYLTCMCSSAAVCSFMNLATAFVWFISLCFPWVHGPTPFSTISKSGS